MSVASPGNQMKVHKGNYWYKGDNLGYEGLAEYICSRLLHHSNVNHVKYDLCRFKIGEKVNVGCVSKSYLLPGETEISLYKLLLNEKGIRLDRYFEERTPVKDIIEFVVETVVELTGITDFGKKLTKILEFDALVRNGDRHYRNIMFKITDNRGYVLAPLFDNGDALLSNEFKYGYERNNYYKVKAKPFSTDFEKQVQACEDMYGQQLRICVGTNVSDYINIQKALEFYRAEQVERALETLDFCLENCSQFICRTSPPTVPIVTEEVGEDLATKGMKLLDEKE